MQFKKIYIFLKLVFNDLWKHTVVHDIYAILTHMQLRKTSEVISG